MSRSCVRELAGLRVGRLRRDAELAQEVVDARASAVPGAGALSGAPSAKTTSPSERSSAATCSAEPGSKKIALSRIGGSGVRTSSSIASWSLPRMGTAPQ